MEKTEKKNFTTLDIYLSAFLALLGVRPELKLNNGKVIFSFPASEDLFKLMMNFNSNVNVPVSDFTTMVKTLRGQMLTMRNGNRSNQLKNYEKDNVMAKKNKNKIGEKFVALPKSLLLSKVFISLSSNAKIAFIYFKYDIKNGHETEVILTFNQAKKYGVCKSPSTFDLIKKELVAKGFLDPLGGGA